jgi:PAS domain-containing protein
VVIFTGRGDEEIAVELMKAGAADYLPKASLSTERLTASLRFSLELFQARAAQRRAEAALQEQREWLRVTFASIGDGVITTDIDGTVTFLNPVAQELTGGSRGRLTASRSLKSSTSSTSSRASPWTILPCGP